MTLNPSNVSVGSF